MNDYLEPYREDIGKDAINALPMVSYDGPVRVVEREEELPEVLKLLQGDTLLGLDTEMRPCFERGKPLRPTALLQLAGERAVVLVRLKNVPVTGPLAALLGDPNILKVGVAIGDDMRLMRRNATFPAAGMVDLAQTARLAGIPTLGLRSLAANFLKVRISKGAQCSNWEKAELSEQQILYAATDAWIGREIYLKMRTIPGLIFQPVDIEAQLVRKPRRFVHHRRSRRLDTQVGVPS